LNQGVGLSTSRNKHGCSSYMIALLVVIKLEWQIGPPRSYACRCPTMQMLHYRSRCNTTIVLALSGKKMGTGCVAGLWDLSIRVNLHVSTIKSQISIPCSMGLETFPLFSIRAPECNDRARYCIFVDSYTTQSSELHFTRQPLTWRNSSSSFVSEEVLTKPSLATFQE